MPLNSRIGSIFTEINRVNQYQQRAERIQATVDSVDLDSASRMAVIARFFPTLKPGIIRSFAQSGITANHPLVDFANRRQAMMDDASALGFGGVMGQLSYARSLAALPPGARQRASQQVRTDRLASEREQENKEAALEAAGIISNGVVTRPTPQEYIDGKLRYRSSAAAKTDRLFFKTMEELATQQDSDDPIPYMQAGEVFLYYPKTGQTAAAEQDEGGGLFGDIPELQLPGPVDEWWRNQRSSLTEFLEKHRPLTISDIPGAPEAPPIQTAGPPSYQTVAREGFAAMAAPLQEATGQVRNAYSALHGGSPNWLESQSDYGVMLSDRSLSAGSGYLVDPNSAVARERVEREATRGQIGGHNLSIGRIFANGINLEPDSLAFNLVSGFTDAAAALKLDPTIAGMNISAKRGIAQRTFQIGTRAQDEAAGLLSGIRRYTRPLEVDNFLNDNTELITHLKDERSAYKIAAANGFRADPQTYARFASARTDESVRAVFTSAVNRGKIRKVDDIVGANHLSPRFSLRNNRLVQRMPVRMIDLEDRFQTAETIRRFMVNAKVSDDLIEQTYNRLAYAKNNAGVRGALDDAITSVDGVLEKWGIADPATRRMLTRLRNFDNKLQIEDLVDEIGADMPNPNLMRVNGELKEVASAHHTLQALSRFYELPDPRAIRRLTSNFRFLTTKDTVSYFTPVIKKMANAKGVPIKTPSGEIRMPFAFADWMMGEVLKPMWLLRVAWPIRTGVDNQARMATSTLSSAFRDPVDWMMIVTGRKLNTDYLGNAIDELDEFQKGLVRGRTPILENPAASRQAIPTIFSKETAVPSEFVYAWGDQIAKLHANPISQMVASEPNLDTVAKWAFSGKGKKYIQELRDLGYQNLDSFDQVKTYASVIAENIKFLTGGQTDLINAIRTGRLTPSGMKGGAPIFEAAPSVSSNFRKLLTFYMDDAPDILAGSKFIDKYDTVRRRWMDKAFGLFMAVPENKLARAPAWKQFYWRHAEELIPAATRTARKKLISEAKKAGLDGDTLRKIIKAANAPSRGRLNLTEISALAKGYALDDTKNLLYDLSERRQWADVFRNAVPFGDAYQEIFSRWAKLLFQTRGKPLRRGQQLITTLRGESTGDVFGAPDGEGFFHENQHGEEVFNYPGSQALTSWLTGVPVPMAGRVESLNMLGTFIPGLGPAVQIPLAHILDNYPSAEWLRKRLVPFGAPGAGESPLDSFLSYGPAWARNFYQAWSEGKYNTRLYANTVMEVASYKQSTGEYGNSPEEQSRLMEDSYDAARELTFIRAWGQFMAPASPSLEYLTKVEDGTLLSTSVLASKYYEWVDDPEIGYENATARFIDEFGLNAIGAIIPKTTPVFYGSPRTLEQGVWWEDNEDLAREFPFTFGLFGPQGGDFHYPTYIKSLQAGTRESYTPEEWRRVMDDIVGSFHYNNAFNKLQTDNPSQEQQAWLRMVADDIQADYPYWGVRAGVPERPKPEDMIRELERAVDNPRLSRTEAGQAIKIYLSKRELALRQVEGYNAANGTNLAGFQEADAFAPTRQWLRDIADDLTEDFPDFRYVWEVALSREMSEDVYLR